MRRIIVTCVAAAAFTFVMFSTMGTDRAHAQSKKPAAKAAPVAEAPAAEAPAAEAAVAEVAAAHVEEASAGEQPSGAAEPENGTASQAGEAASTEPAEG